MAGKINTDKLKKIVKYVGNILTVLAVFYIIISISRMEIDVVNLPNRKKILLLVILGVVITICCLIMLSYAWMQPLQWFGNKKIRFMDVIAIYLKSNIGKYLPGNVVHYVERNFFAVNTGIRQLYIAISSIMEIIIIIVTALGISVFFSYKELLQVFKNFVISEWMILALIVAIILLIIFFMVLLRIPQIKNVLKEIRNTVVAKSGIVVLVKMIICDSVILCSNGICFALICQSVAETAMDINHLIYLMNCYILAWVVGYCILGAPGGIGIRELVIILLAQNIMHSDIVMLSALIHRVITILGDFLGYCISIGINIYLKRCSSCKSSIIS